jgi:hypothetical protein
MGKDPRRTTLASHPMIVGIVAAVVGAVGALAVALVSGTGTSPPLDAPRAATGVAITSVTSGSTGRNLRLVVRGTAVGLPSGVSVYVAVRRSGAPTAGLSDRWVVKPAAAVEGPWTAIIRVPRSIGLPMTVVAFTVNDCNNCSLSPEGFRELQNQLREVDREGPNASVALDRSQPRQATVPRQR